MIYLDNAATTLVKPLQVKQAVFDAMGRLGNSARGMHGPAMEAARELYRAREKAADFFGVADSSQVAFTGNATEALNLAIQGIVKPGMHIIVTEAEHIQYFVLCIERKKKGQS